MVCLSMFLYWVFFFVLVLVLFYCGVMDFMFFICLVDCVVYDDVNFCICKWVKLEDFNVNNIFFGGLLLCWVDEEAVIYVIL